MSAFNQVSLPARTHPKWAAATQACARTSKYGSSSAQEKMSSHVGVEAVDDEEGLEDVPPDEPDLLVVPPQDPPDPRLRSAVRQHMEECGHPFSRYRVRPMSLTPRFRSCQESWLRSPAALCR